MRLRPAIVLLSQAGLCTLPDMDMKPKPFIEFYDPKINDRQLMLLLLYEVVELKSEVRALSNVLLTAHKSLVSSDQFGTMTDSAQDSALNEVWQHAQAILAGAQHPPLN